MSKRVSGFPSPFHWKVRVYIEDTDAGGVVFYANYLNFFERARTEWLRRLGITQQELMSSLSQVFVVSHVSVDYLAPARLDDELTLVLHIERIGGASVSFSQRAWRGEVNLANAKVKVVCVSLPDMRPKAIPSAWLKRMQDGVSA
ncbi:MAG: tol-pal system-associated acyl-CoA thioesterase [Burkholderiaceae bacterium]|jgi:acyl-CoA thioester hydrolase|nr:tol-pal system-associated acyl-CoA thioesterase [Burkholderiaceae bacterium]